MEEIIKNIFTKDMSREEKIHRTREFLQELILKIICDKGLFKNVAFVGGTALQILYNLKRFSEDLDFSIIQKKDFEFRNMIESILSQLEQYGFKADVKKRDEKTVKIAMLKFKDILFKLGLSDIKKEKLSIRIEVDSNPPKGWKTELSLVNKNLIFTVAHFDLPSLYATKLHACFYRRYVKGRDFFDLIWYLGKTTYPNFTLLNNAIEQTEHKKENINKENFKDYLLRKLKDIDFGKIKKDVERFIVDKEQLNLIDKRLILGLVSKRH